MLTNVTYTGQVAHNGDILPGEHPRIISKATFRRVQALIKQNGNGSGKEVRNKHGALLKGLLRCGSCGAAMAHTYTKSGNRLYRYYVCTTAQKQGRDACATPSLPAQEIEDFVVEQIKKIGRDPELARQVFAEAAKQQRVQVRRLKAERKRLQRQRQQKGEEIGRLVAAIASSEQPLASLTERLVNLESAAGKIDERLTAIGSQLEAIKASVIDPDDVATALAEFEPVWEVLQPSERTRIVQLLIEAAEYDAQGGGLHLVFRASCSQRIMAGAEGD
jgi:site-specific DNA recombinase